MKKAFLAALGLALLLSAAPRAAAAPVSGRQSGFHAGGGRGAAFHAGGHRFSGHRVAWNRGGFRGGWGRWRGGWGWGGGRWGGRWGWGSWGWYPPYYYAPYYPEPYGYVAPGANWAVIDTDVSPETARVYLDGRYIGVADDFDGFPDYLYLGPGRYRLEFRLEGYETKVVEVDARPGTKIDIDDKLKRIPGAKQYGSYETPSVPGGVQRFFAKRRGATAPATPEQEAPPEDRRNDDQYAQPEDSRDSYGTPESGPDLDARPEPSDRNRSSSDGWRNRGSGPGSSEARSSELSDRTRLKIHAEPSDAVIYVDDRFVGTAADVDAQESLKLSPGSHNVTVSRPGYKDKTVHVEAVGGKSQTVEIDLER